MAGWLHWLVSQCDMDVPRGPAELGRLTMLNGRQLSRLSRDDIAQLTRSPRIAEMIWTSFNLLLSTANGASRCSNGNRQLLHAKFRCNYCLILTPSAPAVPNCFCSKGQRHTGLIHALFLIFDIRALWRSVLSQSAQM